MIQQKRPQVIGRPFLAELHRRWFLWSLLAILLVGGLFAARLERFAEALPREAIVMLVMFMMALPLATDAMGRALRRPGPALLAVGLSFGLAPLLAWAASGLLSGELAAGLIIAACVPCTLASAAVWTRIAGGNDAVAILVTMITNLSCFVVTPAWIQVLLLRGGSLDLDGELGFWNLAGRLALLVAVPVMAAQVLRRWRPLGEWATRQKHRLSAASQAGILAIVFVGAVKCGLTLRATDGSSPGACEWAVMLAAVAAVHLLLLWLGLRLAGGLGFARGDAIAVGIAGSQKTLMVGLDLALLFGSLAVLPMVAYHVFQLVADTVVAERLRDRAVPGD